MYVYIGQFDAFWRLTTDEWIALCESASKNGGYDLDGYRQLKARPAFLRCVPERKGRYWSKDPSKVYVEPLDWESSDFADAAREAKERAAALLAA
jgi:hypothetical protein